MRKNKMRVILGGLLHDTGKPVQRRDKTVNHSIAGENFLKTVCGLTDEKILEQVRLHHGAELSRSRVADNSLAYITYIADNIAAGADRRKNNDSVGGFDSKKALGSIFNIMNGNNGNCSYMPRTMDESNGINYPTEGEIVFPREIYAKICEDIADCLRGLEYSAEYVNSVLEIMEADCSFIPSSTSNSEIADISLFDHVKITAAVGACIYDYLRAEGTENYKTELYKNSAAFYKKNAFLMYSFDVSGIQDFIYTISSKGTLKLLRARSFYLELLCEHYIDTILEALELSRANLIYSGGGHGYLLLPNTEYTKNVLNETNRKANEWFMHNFKTALYIADAYTLCSADDLMNTSEEYEKIFQRISKKLSERKSCRYSAEDIISMNNDSRHDGERECRICRRSDMVLHDDICPLCEKLMNMSDDILEKEFFVVMKNDEGLPLPFGCSLISAGRNALGGGGIMSSGDYVRSYCKNKQYTGKSVAAKLWVGDYHTYKEFTKLEDSSDGIKRIGVVRADVDNLGKAFVSGFDKAHTSLSRTASFSRKLSIFFKHHINTLFKEKGYNALIVYSGGDDVFMVSAWSDAIPAAMTLRDAFERFSQGTLTISAGIGIYTPKYPIESMAYESGELESASKEKGRNRVTLFSSEDSGDVKFTFEWGELKNKVIGQKKKALSLYFDNNSERGKNMLYNLLDYLRNIREDNKINLARFAYLLARTEPDKDFDEEKKQRHREFSRQMYEWALSPKDRSELIMAIYLYIYETRDQKECD